MKTIYEGNTRYRIHICADGTQVIAASIRVSETERRPAYYRNVHIQTTSKRGKELMNQFNAA